MNLLKSNIATGVQLGLTMPVSFGNYFEVTGYTYVRCLKTLGCSSLTF